MSKGVWISDALMDETKFLPLKSDISLADRDKAIEAQKRNNLGEPLSQDYFPLEIYGSSDAPSFGSLPDIFNSGGYWVVSEACFNVFTKYNLGKCALYPVSIFEKDRKNLVTGRCFCLNFGNLKTAFLPRHSPKANKDRYRDEIWYPPFSMKDNDIAVTEDALVGEEIWIDPKMERSFFVSGALAKEIIANKIDLGLRRCRVM